MQEKVIITIGRQLGSGGDEIGKRVSQKLGLAFYDREILSEASGDSGICRAVFEAYDESPAKGYSYSSNLDSRAGGMNSYTQPVAEQVYLAEFHAIERLANEKSCIFVGRCADYVLKNLDECINVFIHAPLEKRIERICGQEGMGQREAEIVVRKCDREREKYYNYYTTQKWGDVRNYDLTIDTSRIGAEDAADLIVRFAEYCKKQGKIRKERN